MESFLENKEKWHKSAMIVFWSILSLTIFGWISTAIGITPALLSFGAVVNSFFETVTDSDFNEIKSLLGSYITVALIFQTITIICWIVYVYGLRSFRQAQLYENSENQVVKIITACWIYLSSMLLNVIAGYVNWEMSVFLYIVVWILMMVSYSKFAMAFKALSDEISWSERARYGASQLKKYAKLNIWVLIFPLIALLVIGLTYLFIKESMKSDLINIQYYQYDYNRIQSYESWIEQYAKLIMAEVYIFALVMLALYISQVVFLLLGWYKVWKGGPAQVMEAQLSANNAGKQYVRYCHKCGNGLTADASFCSKCGTPVLDSGTIEEVISDNSTDNSIHNDNTIDNSVTDDNYAEISFHEDPSEPEEYDRKKSWMKWGGIILGGVALFFIIYALIYSRGESNSMNVCADNTTIFRTNDGELGEDPLAELQYGENVDSIGIDESGSWIKVSYEKDGKRIEGVAAASDLMENSMFLKADNAGLSNETIRYYADRQAYRRAIADALKDKNGEWVLDVFSKGSNPPALNRITEYLEGLTPSPSCFGFVIHKKDSDTEKEFLLYSIEENTEKPTLVYNETVPENAGMIESLTYKKGVFTVKYENKGVYENVDPSDNSAMNAYQDAMLLQGKIDDEYWVVMELNQPDSEGNITGSYYYLKNNVPISLTGKITDDEGNVKHLSLDESIDGKITGHFIGDITDGSYKGSWLSDDGEKEYPFDLTLEF